MPHREIGATTYGHLMGGHVTDDKVTNLQTERLIRRQGRLQALLLEIGMACVTLDDDAAIGAAEDALVRIRQAQMEQDPRGMKSQLVQAIIMAKGLASDG